MKRNYILLGIFIIVFLYFVIYKKKETYESRIKLNLDELDNIPYYDENNQVINNKQLERMEQTLADKYIKGDSKILELGARYGTVSCVANNKIDDPTQHLVVEPDLTILESLRNNRDSHNSFFHIYDGAISNKDLYLKYDGYGTMAVENGDDKINSKTLNEILSIYDIQFNTLIVDCEGCFPNFVRENQEFVKNIRLILLEKDQNMPEDYIYTDKFLIENGFTLVENIQNFYQVWQK